LQFADKLAHLKLEDLVRLAPQCRCPIEASKSAARALDLRFQVSSALQAVEHRIKRPRTKRIAVTRKFVNHPLPVERGGGGVMQNMQPYQPLEQLLMVHFRHRQPLLGDSALSVVTGSTKQTFRPVLSGSRDAHQGIFRAVGKALASDFVPEHLHASGIGCYNATLGLLQLAASIIAGLVWDHIGHRAVFLYGAVFAAIGAAALAALIPPQTRRSQRR
jgi:Major Facilitator Superfamily